MIEQLGPYRIERLIGRGGMGTVYVGVHVETGQRAAIKSLSVAVADDSNLRERFLTEIETLKKLKHPNIVQLYGDGEQDGHLFYVMELVEGQTLQEELQTGHRFDWPEVTSISIEVCQALKHAHDRGVIHRDLKPGNLLRAPDGHVKLSDFGIAKLFGATHLTVAGSVVGTADYMAPEQAEGQPITARTDLYSLGAVMFTLLARRPPFTAPSLPQVFHKLRFEAPPLVRRFAPQVPPELEQTIQQLLQKNPDDRIPTALALIHRLQAMQHALLRTSGTRCAADDSADAPPPAQDDATRVAADRGPATEVAPTALDLNPCSAAGPADTSTEATLASAEWSLAKLPPEKASASTLATGATRRSNRFTPLPQAGGVSVAADDGDKEPASSHWHTLALGGTLLAVLAVVAWALWPPSADTLYRRIVRTAQEQNVEAAKKDIDTFLTRFPADPRFSEVDSWRRDVECVWLQKRLALKDLKSGGSRLEPYERQLLEAMRLLDKDPAKAVKGFEDLAKNYPLDGAPAGLRPCVEAAEHQLRRLRTPSPP